MGGVLDQLVSPTGKSEFLADYWPHRIFVAASAPDRFGTFLSELSETTSVGLLAAYRGVIKAIYTGECGQHIEEFVDSPRGRTILSRGGTLCLVGVQEYFPSVRDYIGALSAELGVSRHLTQCNAYLSPASHGVSKHFDNRESFIFQISGRKRWKIAENSEVSYPTCNYVAGSEESISPELALCASGLFSKSMPISSQTIELSPGSILFLPRGTWHTTVALEESLSLTVGVFLPTALDLLLASIRARLVRIPRWRRPIALGVAGCDNVMLDDLRRLLDGWQAELNGHGFAEVLSALHVE